MKNRKYKRQQVTKWVWLPAVIIALLFLIRFILPFALGLTQNNEAFDGIRKLYRAVNFDTELCVTLIGIAITVSVGLNIYNTIEKNELSELRQNAQRFETTIQLSLERERISFLNLLQEVPDDGMMNFFLQSFGKKLTNPKTDDIYDDYIAAMVSAQGAYVLVYKYYNSSPYGNDHYSIALDNAIENLPRSSDYLYNAYRSFLHADMLFFSHNYPAAIEYYQKTRDYITYSNEENIPVAKAYLINSIALACQRDGKFDEALEQYKGLDGLCLKNSKTDKSDDTSEQIESSKMDELKEEFAKLPYIWRFYRNYGTCIENIASRDNKEEKFREAIRKYEFALKYWQPHSGEYKHFITYCSATMKMWDLACEKTSEHWHISVRESGNIDDDTIHLIEERLDVVERIHPEFADTYVQRAKLLTYKMLRSGNIGQYVGEIKRNLAIAKSLKYDGRKYVKRDHFHALWLLTSDQDKKKEYVKEFKKINDGLKNQEAEGYRTRITAYSEQ